MNSSSRRLSRCSNGAVDVEAEFLLCHMRLGAKIEHRPVFHQTLAGRQPVPVGHAVRAGQQAAVTRPLLFALDQLVTDLAGEFDIVISHADLVYRCQD